MFYHIILTSLIRTTRRLKGFNKDHIINGAYTILQNTMTQLKDLIDGIVVGSGSDYLVIKKGKKRFLIECLSFKILELKTAATPYGSQID